MARGYTQHHKRQQAVEHQQLIAEMVVPQQLCHPVCHKTQQRRGDGNTWHEAVTDGTARQQPIGKQAQQRAVSIRDDDIDSINETGRIDRPEHEDEEDEEHTHHHVGTLPQPFVGSATTDVHTVDGGQRRQRRVGTGE